MTPAITPNQHFELGEQLRDMVTGYTGIATGRMEYLNGCTQYCLRAKADKESKVPDSHWVDSQQIERVSGGIKVKRKPTGGPTPGERMPSRSPR